jgi:hypothetical protein
MHAHTHIHTHTHTHTHTHITNVALRESIVHACSVVECRQKESSESCSLHYIQNAMYYTPQAI